MTPWQARSSALAVCRGIRIPPEAPRFGINWQTTCLPMVQRERAVSHSSTR